MSEREAPQAHRSAAADPMLSRSGGCRAKAAHCAMSVGRFMLAAALDRQTSTRIDAHIVNELRRLGEQQKELFHQGGGAMQLEYATLLAESTRAIVRMAA